MNWKHRLLRILGKDPEAIVVSFLSGPEPLARAMLQEVQQLLPDREHWAVTDLEIVGIRCVHPGDLPGPLRRKRIGLAPTLFTGERSYRALRWAAFKMAPTKLLAYNARLERHHLRWKTCLASFLFLRGVPLDRIWLRPAWLFPWKRDRTVRPRSHTVHDGKPLTEGRRRVAVLTPYFPYPLSHGGAVRIFNLLREASKDFDVFLFAFGESVRCEPVLEYCAKTIIFPQPRYREPRWASLLPPEVNEFSSDYVRRTVEQYRRQHGLDLVQVEYTQLASYRGDILVEHDITFELFDQIRRRDRTLTALWDWWRWHRFERKALQRFRRVVVMSAKDAGLLHIPHSRIIPNGVDLARFVPEPECPGARLLFVGSFRHFPNVVAYRFFTNEVWPLLADRVPGLHLTVIAGPDPERYCETMVSDPRIELHGFVADVRPFYAAANVVIVPTEVSAGTNLKVLEAMAMERAIVSTTSGCGGLDLEHGRSVWIADGADAFAAGVERLLSDPNLRGSIAGAALQEARRFDWRKLGRQQKRMWTALIAGVTVRAGTRSDGPAINGIQQQSKGASLWEPDSYFEFDVLVAEVDKEIAGFLVSREISGEVEVLNIAVALAHRGRGVATALLSALPDCPIFLEVRESNENARKLYTRMGFVVVGHRDEYYDDPVETALVMRLSPSTERDTV